MLAQSLNPSQVEKALLKAGKNRASLERVLKLYQNDKEKYAAACYLIANMPLHSQAGAIEWYDPQIDKILEQNDQAYYCIIKGTTGDEQERNPLHETIKQTANESAKRLEQLKLQEPRITEAEMQDITTLTGDFIQQQIELAFSLRERMPRLKQMPLDDFFEYVLA